MPNSCRSIIKKCLFKGAISEKEADKLLRNVVDVRCEDCKYYGGKMNYQHPYKECTRHHCLSAPTDFCSKAEPKTDRDCSHCTHHTDNGCEKWECEFERREE